VARFQMSFDPGNALVHRLPPRNITGALVDGEGKLVGLVAAIFTRAADANIGVNFAISTALLTRVADDLIAQGRVVEADVRLSLVPLPSSERRMQAGLRVGPVTTGDAEVRAGLEPGDIVTAIAGRAMRKPGDALTALYLQRPGDRVAVAIRRGGEEKTLTLEIPR